MDGKKFAFHNFKSVDNLRRKDSCLETLWSKRFHLAVFRSPTSHKLPIRSRLSGFLHRFGENNNVAQTLRAPALFIAVSAKDNYNLLAR